MVGSKRFCKTMLLSNDERFLYVAGLTQEIDHTEAAFISTHDIYRKRSPKEVSTVIVKDCSHDLKKGFYRLNLIRDPKHSLVRAGMDILVVGGWLDLNIFTFDTKSEVLVQIHRYEHIHSSK